MQTARETSNDSWRSGTVRQGKGLAMDPWSEGKVVEKKGGVGLPVQCHK